MRTLLDQESMGNTLLFSDRVLGDIFDYRVTQLRAVFRNEKVLLMGDLAFLRLIFLRIRRREAGGRPAPAKESLFMTTVNPPRLTGAVALILAMALVIPTTQALDHDRNFDQPRIEFGPDEFRIDPEVFGSEIGRRHEITAVPLPGHRDRVELELTRFRVFAEDAKIVVHTAEGDLLQPIPDNRYFHGKVVGEPNSIVVISMLEGGEVRGLIVDSGSYWVFSGDTINKSLSSTIRIREIEPTVELEHKAQAFSCGTDDLHPLPPLPSKDDLDPPTRVHLKSSVSYTAKIAVETDHEFFNLFGNSTDAANYVADIIAFGSSIYSSEISTSWVLQHLSLWSTAADPWTQTSAQCGLYEFGRYWNDNESEITRTIAHFMSGKNTGGGIAWVGVLCYPGLNYTQTACAGLPAYDNYAGGYGFSGDLTGGFDFNNPAITWDIFSVTHEIGHNFNSPHTHCYANIGGNSNPIDECYGGECGLTGCHCGGTGLPSGCPGEGQGCGTIMSYCHLQGGMDNISLTVGAGHPYGIEPDRVPTRMAAHVAERAAASPGCLDYVSVGEIFLDGFEGGNTSAWSSVVP
jgi:hypothetical protein